MLEYNKNNISDGELWYLAPNNNITSLSSLSDSCKRLQKLLTDVRRGLDEKELHSTRNKTCIYSLIIVLQLLHPELSSLEAAAVCGI